MIITLTTDFGEKDPFVGVMKGVILSRFAGAQIVDLTHGIEPQNVAEAAFWLSRSFAYFPPGTVHVAVVDPGVGTSRAILAIEAEQHFFLAPDNGLLGPLFDRAALVRRVDRPDLMSTASATFHGRDVFAPLAAELASGRVRIDALGPLYASPVASALPAPGVVVTIDRFGNLITNLRAADVARFRQPVVIAGGLRVRVARTYGDARAGELIALIGSFDALELAVVNGDAARTTGIGRGTAVSIEEES